MLMKNSIERLTAMLRLPATGAEQDWEMELADPSRVDEFVALFDRLELEAEDRKALMALVLGSANAFLEKEGEPPATWVTIANLLADERELHADTLSYWSRDDSDDPEEWFPLTPYVRAVLGEQRTGRA
jgi:hypothetical protein